MTLETSTAAKIKIAELAAKYGHYCDHPGWEGVLDLFTDDAVFDAADVYGKVMKGKEELRGFFESAPDAVAHHPTSQFTEIADDGTAVSRIKMLVLFRRQTFSVDYEWNLVQQDGAWRINRQRIHVVGSVRNNDEAAS